MLHRKPVGKNLSKGPNVEMHSSAMFRKDRNKNALVDLKKRTGEIQDLTGITVIDKDANFNSLIVLNTLM